MLAEDGSAAKRFLVVPTSAFDETRRHRLHADVARLLDDAMSVTVETVTDLPPEPSGKRPIIKHYDQSRID